MPRSLVVADQTLEINCAPRSLESWEGMPKRATQCQIKALAQDKVVAPLIGTASGQRVNRSTMVRRNRCSCDGVQGANEIDVYMVKLVSSGWIWFPRSSYVALCFSFFGKPHNALPTSRPISGAHAKRTLKQSTFALSDLKDVKVHGWHQKLVCAMRGEQWA